MPGGGGGVGAGGGAVSSVLLVTGPGGGWALVAFEYFSGAGGASLFSKAAR